MSNIAIQAVNVKAEQKVPERNEIGDLCFNNLRDKRESSVSLGPSRSLSERFQPKDKGKLFPTHIGAFKNSRIPSKQVSKKSKIPLKLVTSDIFRKCPAFA